MGCKQSTTVKVQPVGQSAVKQDNTKAAVGKEGATQTPTNNRKILSRESTVSEYELDEQGNKVRRKKGQNRSKPVSRKSSRNTFGSTLSIDDERSLDGDRGFSATSKASADSGLGGDDAPFKGLENIITEYSNADDVKRVEQSFIERDDLDLGICGTQLATRLSAKDKTRLEASTILQSLREDGLIAKPTTQSSGGMSFEIVAKDSFDSTGLPLPPPRQLAKLERRRKKKKVLTEDEIRQKLEKAELRRKTREEERLNKIKEMEKKDALSALENFETYKKEKEEQQLHQKMDVAEDNRQKRMQEIKEKLKERERRAAEVRRRKQKALEEGLQNSGVIESQEYPDGADN